MMTQPDSRVLIPATLFVAAVAHAGDRPLPQVVEHGRKVEPLRIASIGADLRLTSDWYEYGAIAGTGCSTSTWFDCFDPDSDGAPSHAMECGLPAEDSRWFMGTPYCNMFVTDDYETSGEPCDIAADRISFAWYWTGDGNPNGIERCFVLIQSYNGTIGNCMGPDRDTSTLLDGFVFDFGDLPTNSGDYFFADVDLCLLGLDFEMGFDGTGAFDQILGQAYDSGSGEVTLATCAQPMLWGTSHPNEDIAGPGKQASRQWNDDNPSDGTHTPFDECANYQLGLCPDPLGVMFAMYGPSPRCGSGKCVTLNIPLLVAGENAVFSGRGIANSTIVVLYAFDSQPGVLRQFGDFCVESELLPSEGNGVVFVTSADGRGEYSQTVFIPGEARGRDVVFQAFGSGTCPDECDSVVIEKRII